VRSYDWSNDFSELKNGAEKTGHPCQLPVEMMLRVLNLIPARQAQIIVDPFMGSGTTGVAALQLDRKFIGIEQSAKFFDIACARLEQASQAAAA
jgi:DNA modification methylase